MSNNKEYDAKYDDSYYAKLQEQVHGNPYSNETHTHYPSPQQPNSNNTPPANRSNATSKKRKMPQNNTSTDEVTILTIKYDSDKIQNGIKKDKQKYLLTKNHGFKLTFQGPNQEDTDTYEIVQGNDGEKSWKSINTGGKRRTRSSRKRSKRTNRKQRK
uniref:Uncharacterized protein n=1 Tax=viral metagenome TaxID=1070528 RepID=A0A6C0HK00_9ZZZZ